VTLTAHTALPSTDQPSAQAQAATCTECHGTGRHRPYLPASRLEKNCVCPLGRSMSLAHWAAKGNEEVAA
jgi:hypothetical protein